MRRSATGAEYILTIHQCPDTLRVEERRDVGYFHSGLEHKL